MQSEHSFSLTRYDVVMWFLRVLMCTFVVRCLEIPVTAFVYFNSYKHPAFGLIWNDVVYAGLPLVILLVFPSLLAVNVLGSTAREPVSSLASVKPLVGRCAGLYLLLHSLPTSVSVLGAAIYQQVTHPKPSFLAALFGTPNSSGFWILVVYNAIIPSLSLIVGLLLAFGPAMRDNFRSP